MRCILKSAVRLVAVLLSSVFFLLPLSCTSEAEIVVSVSIAQPERTVLYLGDDVFNSIQLSSVVESSDNKDRPVVWSVSDPSVVEVNQVTGLVTAKKLGKVIVKVSLANAGNMSTSDMPGNNVPDPFSNGMLNVKSDAHSDSLQLTVAARVNVRGVNDGGNSQAPSASGSSSPDDSSSSDAPVVATNILEYLPTSGDEGGAPELQWGFEPADVIRINEAGILEIINPEYVGTVTVVGVFPNGSDVSFDVEVGKLAESIEISASEMKLAVGCDAELIASVLPADTSRKSVKWFSSDDACVSVTPKGSGAESQRAVVKALKIPESEKGNPVIVTAISDDGGYVATSSVTVVQQPESVRVSGVRICLYDDVSADLSDGLWLSAGESRRLLPAISPSNATNRKCSLAIDNDLESGYSDDSISLDGDVVTALALGKTGRVKAVCEDGGVFAYLDVHVKSDVLVIEESSDEPEPIIAGESDTIRIDAGSEAEGVEFEASSDLIDIEPDGTVTIKDAGSHSGEYVDVIVKYPDGTTKTVPIVIGDEILLKSIKHDSDVMIYETLEKRLEYGLDPVDTTFKDVVWKSKNEDIAKVDESGNVTAVSEGETTITVRSVRFPDIYAEYKVKVRKPKIEYRTYSNGSWNIYRNDSVATNSDLKACIDLHAAPNAAYNSRNWKFSGWVLPSSSAEGLNPSNMSGSAPVKGMSVTSDVVVYASYVLIPIVDFKVYDGASSKWVNISSRSGEVEPGSDLAGLVAKVTERPEADYDEKIWNFSKWVVPSSGDPEALNPSNLDGSTPDGIVNEDVDVYASYALSAADFKYMYWEDGEWKVFHNGGEYSGDDISSPASAPQDVEFNDVIYTFNSWSVPSSEVADPSSAWTGSAVPSKTKRNVSIYAKYDRKPISVKYVYWKNSTDKWSQYKTVSKAHSGDDFDDVEPTESKIIHGEYTYKFFKWVIPNSENQYKSSATPDAGGSAFTDMSSKLKDNVTVYAYYSPSADIEYKIWDKDTSKWVKYDIKTMFFDANELPVVDNPPETEYEGKLYVFSDWLYFSASPEGIYRPANNTAGKVAVVGDIKNDGALYARYQIKSISLKYSYYDGSENKWVEYDEVKEMASGDAFSIPQNTPEGIVEDGSTYAIAGWTLLDQSAKSVSDSTVKKIDEDDLLEDGVTLIKDSACAYAVYKKLTLYPNLVRIPAVSSFSMQGKSALSLSQFYVSDHEVTHQEWEKVGGKGSDPSFNAVALYGESADYLPVEYVSWFDAVDFCNKLSEKEGLDKCYEIEDVVIGGKTEKRWKCDFKKNGYRLLTETEWEYAASGGSSDPYSGSNEAGSVAWCGETQKHQVRKKDPNGFGLYDMSGNVGEWCWDWMSDAYTGSGLNYAGPDTSSSTIKRVYRGGRWDMEAEACKVSERYSSSPNAKSKAIGFRICRSHL